MGLWHNMASNALIDLLGDNLQSESGPVPTTTALKDVDAIGIYFSAHWCPPCRGFTPKLAEIYNTMKAAGKKFEIIFASSDRDTAAFDEYFKEQPWLAIPYVDRSKKDALSKKFKVQGIPTLVIVVKEGKTITTDGRSAVTEDPTGSNFPWVPPTFAEVTANLTLVKNDGSEVPYSSLQGKTIGIYFSAHWCPPCRGFTPELVKTYNKMKQQGKEFEIIFASSDRDEASFKEYFAEMPWLALPYSERDMKAKLSKIFNVEGIPSFHIIEYDGTVINNNGRGAVGGDPEGKEFPWHPKPVNDLAAGPDGINETPSLIVLMEGVAAEKQAEISMALETVATKTLADAEAAKAEAPFCFFTGKAAGGVTDRVRELCKGGDVSNQPQMFLLDIPDNGAYYKAELADITEKTVAGFLADCKSKSLSRQQLE